MEYIIDLIVAGRWALLFGTALLPVYAAVLNGLIVRMSKPDALGPNLSPRWRPFLSLGLGVAEGVVLKVGVGETWKRAVVGAVIAGLLPVVMHVLVIHGLRDGRELPPLLSADDEPRIPGPPRVPTILPVIMLVASVGVVSLAFAWACTPAKTAAAEKMAADGAVCVIEQYERDPHVTPGAAAAACAGVLAEDALKVLVAHRRSTTRTVVVAAPCGSAR